jgi:putative PIN family toxin of toxin-antitoxin system
VLDTNTLVASAYAPASASRQIVDACLRGELVALVSKALEGEYRHILERAVRGREFEEPFQRLMAGAVFVEPPETPRVVPDDPEDDKLLATAVAGEADAVITNDHHLLELDPYGPIRILRPAQFIRFWGWR